MKIVLLLLIFSIACTKKEDYWNKLTAEEQEIVRRLAQDKCIADIATAKADFIAESNNFASLARGLTFKFDYKVKDAATSDIVRKMVVLKSTATELYVFLQVTDNSTDTNYVIKVETADNTAQIEQMVTDHCNKNIKLTGTTDTIWQSYDTDDATSEDTSDEDFSKEHTFKFVINQPVFFGRFDYFFKKNTKNRGTGAVTTINYETIRSTPTFALPTKATLDAADHCTFTDTTLPFQPTSCASNVYDTTYLSTN